MTASYLLQGGLVLDPTNNVESILDVRIAGDTIVECGKALGVNDGETVFDAAGLWICPGLVDIHCHLRDLGQKDKEDIETGTRAAAAGGYTTVVVMANTEPPLDNAATLRVLMQRIQEKAHIEVLPVACVTKALEGLELTNMVELADLGVVAFSDDGQPISNMAVLKRALEYARLTDRLIISHAEDRDLSSGGVIHEGAMSCAMGLAGISPAAETVAVAREIEIVRQVGAPYHFTHLSCAGSVELVRRARADGLPISADATPHHLTLTVDQIVGFDANYKMKPPLRTDADQKALIEGLKDGTIGAIGTDHAPHTRLEKQRPMDEAAVGLIGLETALSLLNEKLVVSGMLSKMQLIALMTSGPAKILDLTMPGLQTDAPANVAIIDPQMKWSYDAINGYSKSRNSPFHGKMMTGKNIMTIYRGKAVYRDEAAVSKRLKG